MNMHIPALLGVLCLVVQAVAAKGKHWGLLVAGARGYENYSIQASICHAYQLLKAHGIPDERIVVMMYDDLAYNPSNPDQGKIINRPDGPNVYPGVPKDYIKEDVTPEIFLKVLQDQKTGTGSGKIIKSGPDDNIFINLMDHGMPAMPRPSLAKLHPHLARVRIDRSLTSVTIDLKETIQLMANDLISALKSMHKKQQYNQMVIYIEACYSGSMFYHLLPKDINVFATTAANPWESSYACYWVERLHAYVGGVYSCNWMENSDKEDLRVETLQKQYRIVRRETNTSHVQEYGDMKMGSDVMDDFLGISNGTGYVFDPFKGVPITDAVPFVDVPLHVLERKIANTGRYSDDEILGFVEEWNALLQRRKRNLAMMETIASLSGSTRINAKEYYLNSRLDLTQHACYKDALGEISQICFNGHLTQDQFAGHQMHVLINMCEDRVPIDNMIIGMRQACFIGN